MAEAERQGGAGVDQSLASVRRFLRSTPAPRPREERCEMCATPIEPQHPHAVNVETRRLICACRPCYFLFAPSGAAGGKIRAIPQRCRRDLGLDLDESTWAQFQIPVRMAFFFTNSHLGKVVAFYPSPAGATESLLALDAWNELVARNPILAELEPDVEALLVHAPRGGAFDCLVVPIDACYELVGRVRRTWRGFDGGAEAWAEIDGFLAALRERAEPVMRP